jgi:hypothetical protein
MEKFARRCDITGRGMNEGYVVGAGDLYFSEKEDFVEWLKDVAKEEGLDFETDSVMMEHYYDEELYYYTEWDELDDDVYYDADGNEYTL